METFRELEGTRFLINFVHVKLLCSAGGSKLTTLDKFVYKTPKPPVGRPVQKKRSQLTRPRATPLVSKNQVNLKQPAASIEQVSTGKQPIVAETVLKQPATMKGQVSIGKKPVVAESAPKCKPQV